MRRLCFELYGKPLTTRQVGEITEKIYGNPYSSSAVSSFNQKLKSHLDQWRERPLQARYPVLYGRVIGVETAVNIRVIQGRNNTIGRQSELLTGNRVIVLPQF